ncbi:N-acetyltransferase family protein [Pleomorphomonas sp. PLEO]|uniref:GNAT family N-acetyltransferase n=1 Tax=Pleomorphomonas sp. PLEO TaxID=3239306 RepID=UPI00351F4767
MTIRRLEATDVDIFKRIRLEALRLEPAAYAGTYDDWSGLSEEEWLKRMSEPVFVAFEGEAPVGLAGLIRQRGIKMAHRAVIVMVYLRQSLRGTGLASGLLNAVAAHASDMGIRQLELTVSAENPAAIRFYQREGFSEVGRIPAALLHDGREIDEFVMVRRIV